ncbi:uncharacterized protein LOC126900357 isoform X2 [Daktulosphaira vitifoliae]|uniref:uncharacterized protein LOC126900357 isoform X2 n=1 Tax=Daktulosphaira vitifoliae TaxID=58002 RepID=UPI0021AAE843|nr:uncharacterized protein LOC126900357 isoform X2 [Daktulosphaira vitifoliae]
MKKSTLSKFIMYLHIFFTILVFLIPTLTKPTPNTEWSKFDELIIAMGGYIVNHQITLYNFIKALKKCGSIYDNLAINWFESGLTGEQMLNIEPLLILVTNNFDNQLIKKIEFVYKTLNNNNDGQIDILKYRAISILCGIPINTSSEHDKLLIAIGGYIVNQQISLNNFIKVLKNFGSEYDNFATKWIESGLDGEQMLNVEPLLILATNNFENQSIKKTEFVYKTLKNNNDGKIDILKYRSIYNLSDIPLDTSSEHDKLLIAMGGYIVNQQISLKNFIKVLKNFGSKYDKFAKKWIESGLEDERMLNIEPLLILVTDDFENQSIKKTEFVYKALNNNNDGKIDVLDD